MTSSITVPPVVVSAIRRYRQHSALLGVATRMGLAILIALAIFLIGVAVDRFVEIPIWVRVGELVLGVVVVLGGVVGSVVAVARTLDQEANATAIDRAVPGSRDVLRSTLDFLARTSDPLAHTVHPFMLAATTHSATELAAAIQPARLLGWRKVPALAAGVLLLALVVAGFYAWPMMQMGLLVQRFFNPTGNFPRPSLTRIEVSTPLRQRVAEGTDVAVSVTLSGQVPSDVSCVLNLVTGKLPQAIPMIPRPGGRFELTMRSVDTGLSYFITAGDGKTASYSVDVDPLPRVTNLIAHYTFPSYTRLPKLEEPVKFGEVRAVEGTRVRLDFESTMPITESAVLLPDRKLKIQWDRNQAKGAQTKGSFEFTLDQTFPFHIHLVDTAGVDNHDTAAFRARAIPDNPPTVSLLNLPDNLTFYRDEIFRLGYHGTDDFGISEVFIRSSVPKKAGSGTKETSIPFDQTNPKDVSGELQLELGDMVDSDTSELQIQLIMVDTKGQESASQRLELSIISDTLDRMLAELAAAQDRFVLPLAITSQSLNSASGQLGVLIDGMNDATKIDGARAGILGEVGRDLGANNIPNISTDLGLNRVFTFSNYPNPAMRQTQLCMSNALAILPGSYYAKQIKAISAESSPRGDLVKLQTMVDAQKAHAQTLVASLRGAIIETRLEIVQVLIEEYLATRDKLKAGPGMGDAAVAYRDKQELRLSLMSKVLKELDPYLQGTSDAETSIRTAIAPLETALAVTGAPDERDRACIASLQDLQAQFRSGPIFDGHLGIPTETYENAYPMAQQLDQANGDPAAIDAIRLALGSRLRLRRADPSTNAAELLVAGRLYEASLTEDRQRIAAATQWANANVAWVQGYGVINRLLNLRNVIRDFNADIEVGRIAPKGVRFDQAWQAVREAYLSLVSDDQAGGYSALDAATQADLASLKDYRPVFEPINGIVAFQQPQFKTALAAVGPIVDKVVNHLWPTVEAGSKLAVPQTTELIADMATNFAQETPRLATEVQAIKAEVAAAPKTEHPVLGKAAKPERMAFAVAMQDRIACHAAALAQALDIRERIWTQNPDPTSRKELASLSVLFEYLSHQEEDFYDRSIAYHIQAVTFKNQVYPGFLDTIGGYFETLEPDLTKVAGWLAQAGKGQAADLLNNEEYATLLKHINKASRFDQGEKSMSEHIQFITGYDAAHTPADRKVMLTTLANDVVNGSVYWEHLYTLLDGLNADIDQSIKSGSGAAWPGLSPELEQQMTGTAKVIQFILPDTKPVPEEAKAIAELMTALEPLLERAQVSKVAALSPANRDLVREDLIAWQGEVAGGLQSIVGKASPPPVPNRPRSRLTSKLRYDLERIRSRLTIIESGWAARAIVAARRIWEGRADALLTDQDQAAQRRNVAWLAAEDGSTRRKSAAAMAQRNHIIGPDGGSSDEQYLKMPKYLYEELMRGSVKPAPEQFKDTAVKYMEDLLKDSR